MTSECQPRERSMKGRRATRTQGHRARDYESCLVRRSRTISTPVSAASRPLLVWSGSRAHEGLVERVGGEDAENDRQAGVELHPLDAGGALPRHEVVVPGVTSDHGAETEHGVDLARLSERAGHQGQLEGTRSPGHRDVAPIGADLGQRVQGAMQQPHRHAAVEEGAGDADPQPRAVGLATQAGPDAARRRRRARLRAGRPGRRRPSAGGVAVRRRRGGGVHGLTVSHDAAAQRTSSRPCRRCPMRSRLVRR